MDQSARSPLRFIAPLVLIAAALVFFVVLSGGLGGGDDGATEDAAVTEPADDGAGDDAGGGGGGGGRGGGEPETYEVQSGDTLDSIAAETDTDVEQILELNPQLDPQSLIAGEEIEISE